MKYVLITPCKEAHVLFFKGVQDRVTAAPITLGQQTVTTKFLSKAHVFEYTEEQMQYVLDKMGCLQNYSAVPINDVNIFKAKLAGI